MDPRSAAVSAASAVALSLPGVFAAGLKRPSVEDWSAVNRSVPRFVDVLPNGPANHPTVRVFLAGGVPDGREIQAVLLGGAAGSFVRPDELDLELSFEAVREAKTTLGSGVVMVFDDSVEMHRILQRIAQFGQ